MNKHEYCLFTSKEEEFKKLIDCIPVGKRNKDSVFRIADQLGYGTERTENLILDCMTAGYAICVNEDGHQYYLPETKKELEESCNRLLANAVRIVEAINPSFRKLGKKIYLEAQYFEAEEDEI